MAKISTRLNLPGCPRLIDMFSPPATLPVRSSPSSAIHGGEFNEPNELPSAWITPLRPSANSYRQPRSRSTPLGAATAAATCFIFAMNPLPPGGRGGATVADQLRLTLAMPPTAPDLVSETRGAPLVSETRPPAGAAGAAGADGAAAAAGAGGAGAA